MAIKLNGLDDIMDSLDKVVDTENVSAALMKACALVERSAK